MHISASLLPFARIICCGADPIDACTPMEKDTFASAIVLARRGVCTFSTKERIAAEASVAAIILVNNEDGNDHLAGPVAHDIGISVGIQRIHDSYSLR